MRIKVIRCTQSTLVGYTTAELDLEALGMILMTKMGYLYKGNHTYCFKYDYIKLLGRRKFILLNSNMMIWCKSNQNMPPFESPYIV